MMNLLSADQFEALLHHLGPDHEAAGRQYEDLRRRLIVVFSYRRCPNPEDLADETLDRVARKLVELGDKFAGTDPTRFVFGVAWNIAKESLHRHRDVPLSEDLDMADPSRFVDDDAARSRGEACLDRCMHELGESDRTLVLQYYQEDKRARITRRSALARQLGVTPNALRLRIHRITLQLRDCVDDCLKSSKPRPVRVQ